MHQPFVVTVDPENVKVNLRSSVNLDSIHVHMHGKIINLYIEYYYATGYWQKQSDDEEDCSCYGTKVSHECFVMPGGSLFSIKLISTSRPWKSFMPQIFGLWTIFNRRLRYLEAKKAVI